MITLMTAIEAKAKADDINEKIFNAELNMVLKNIETRAGKGEYKFSGSSPLLPRTVEELQRLGYAYETGGRMGEIEYNITWK